MIGDRRLEGIDCAFREVETPAGVGDPGIREDGGAGGGGGRRWDGGAPGGADGAEAEDVSRGGEVFRD